MPKLKPAPPSSETVSAEDERILSTEELLDRVPLDRSTIWRLARDGLFPKPIHLTPSRIGWRWSAVLRWLAEREQHPIAPRAYFGEWQRRRTKPAAPATRRP